MGALKYIGTDPATDWLPGVPARDLTEDEAKRYPEASKSRLYEAVKPPATRRGKERA